MEELITNPLGIAIALMFLLELYNTVCKTLDNAKARRKPSQTVEDRLNGHDRKLDNDKKRIDDLTDGQVVCIKGIKALLWHERTGNSVDKLATAADEIDTYLTERK